MFGFFKKIRRKRLIKRAFPQEWHFYLKRHLPMYRYLSEEKRKELENHTKILLAEKKFVGAQGFAVTDFMKVLVCAQASILLLSRKTDYFPNVETIVIYPHTFISRIQKNAGGGFHLEEPEPRVGSFVTKQEKLSFHGTM